ncbi:hypothetical protein DBR40_03290 [Pedobacter sp. KBW01]|nr:hypothetical protein DBR40_03290 [Pedobacter sp. KBW01]
MSVNFDQDKNHIRFKIEARVNVRQVLARTGKFSENKKEKFTQRQLLLGKSQRPGITLRHYHFKHISQVSTFKLIFLMWLKLYVIYFHLTYRPSQLLNCLFRL